MKQLDLFEELPQNKVLTFVRRGMDYEPKYEGDICNYRISADFKNNDGKSFYVEFLRSNRPDHDFWCDFSIDKDREKVIIAMKEDLHSKAKEMKWNDPNKSMLHKEARDISDDYYNFGGLERNRTLKGWNKESILSLVNSTFNCSFTEIELI